MARPTPAIVRKIALSMPGALEQDHHGIPSFRIDGKIFATLWDPDHLNIMISPVRIVEVASENPNTCKEIWWGHRLSCVQVELSSANQSQLKKLLTEAFNYKKEARKKRNITSRKST